MRPRMAFALHSPSGSEPPRPAPFQRGRLYQSFVRGRERPRGIVWFGIRSFWGHLRHFVASAIATEDVDSRDWMTPDEPRALAERVSRLLGASTGFSGSGSVTERLGREVWVDYVADTGDDVSVSRAVAGLIFTPYGLPDPERPGYLLYAPRGDILFFGGDTAYPVATADEIRDRVIAPFNQVLAQRDDGRRRVLLGIPGNHDWYDGLDGFGRMFRRHVDYAHDGRARPTLHGSSRTLLGHYAEWAREFVRGGQVEKPKTLDLIGYTAVQAASYFVLPLAPNLSVLAVDRQLKHVDSRQQHFFSAWLNQHLAVSPWVILPDPVYAFGTPSRTGFESIQALGLTLSARPHLVVSGDIHHYRRDMEGPTLHVTAGGGGAFLHPAPLHHASSPPLAEWPDGPQSRVLLRQVKWKVAFGRSGIIPHLSVAALLAPALFAAEPWRPSAPALVIGTLLVAALIRLVGGLRRRFGMTDVLAVLTAACVTACGVALRIAFAELLAAPVDASVLPWLASACALFAVSPVGAWFFGAYLALLTRLGYEHLQAFAALDHPGFKHFVRFRVRRDGSAVDGWCIGLVDPIRPGEQPVLVDQFTWYCR